MKNPDALDDFAMAEYVMGLSGSAENAAIERRLRDDAPLREQYYFWINHFQDLSGAYQTAVSPVAYATVARRLFGAPQKTKMPLWLKLTLIAGCGLVLVIKIRLAVMIFQYFASGN